MPTLEIIGALVSLFPIYGLLFSMNRKLGKTVALAQENSSAIDRLENHVYGRGPANA